MDICILKGECKTFDVLKPLSKDFKYSLLSIYHIYSIKIGIKNQLSLLLGSVNVECLPAYSSTYLHLNIKFLFFIHKQYF